MIIGRKRAELITRLKIIWNELALNFGKDFHGPVGSCSELDLFAKHTGKAWIVGKRRLDHIF